VASEQGFRVSRGRQTAWFREAVLGLFGPGLDPAVPDARITIQSVRRLVVEVTDSEYPRPAPTSLRPPDYIRFIVRQVLEHQKGGAWQCRRRLITASARPASSSAPSSPGSSGGCFWRDPQGYGKLLHRKGGDSMKFLATLAAMAIVAVGSFVMSASASAAAHCHGLTATMTGTTGSDHIVGTSHRDVIVARAGNDFVRSAGGRDVICAGRGDDVVRAGKRHDLVYGGRGVDVLRGAIGADRLFGERGRDQLFGESGNDTLSGGFGTDEGFGGSGTNTCLSIEFAHGC
jgi:hypothetical protein